MSEEKPDNPVVELSERERAAIRYIQEHQAAIDRARTNLEEARVWLQSEERTRSWISRVWRRLTGRNP